MTPELKVAIVHYHLRGGGVTQVIRHTAAALTARGARVVVLSGEPPAAPFAEARMVEGLGYAETGSDLQPDALCKRMREAAHSALGGAPDVWHLHNHSLGKNPALTAVVSLLAREGDRLLLHLHDFPEDGRPGLYRSLCEALPPDAPLYPQASHIFYAVLNDRDHDALTFSGVEASRLRLLLNPIALDPSDPPPPDGRRLFLYPTRAIRRKNVGEFLLWAALGGADDVFATTLAPKNPAERPRYDEWAAFAQQARLPVTFGLGETSPLPFSALLKSAHAIVTTSVAEGFGLAYLEPWLAGRPVCGRKLPRITASMEATGLRLPGLYERLEIPAGWVDAAVLRTKISSALKEVYRLYDRSAGPEEIDAACAAAGNAEQVEFGHLDEELQRKAIAHLLDSPEDRTFVSTRLFPAPVDTALLEGNRALIERDFGLESYATRLLSVYADLLSAPSAAVTGLPPDEVLTAFLKPENFFLLRAT